MMGNEAIPTETPLGFELVGDKGCYWYADKLTHSEDCECKDVK